MPRKKRTGKALMEVVDTPAREEQQNTPAVNKSAPNKTVPNVTGILSVADTVIFKGSTQYRNVYAGFESEPARPCIAALIEIASGRQHPYYLSGPSVNGWVNAVDIEGVTKSSGNPEMISAGDMVMFHGDVCYSGAYAGAEILRCQGGRAKVTAINRNGTYSYCLEHIEESCTVSGWVNAELVTRLVDIREAAIPLTSSDNQSNGIDSTEA